jgi:hypothetical protein
VSVAPRISTESSTGFGRCTHERPHEGLNNQTPGSLYHSSVILPRTLIEYAYPKEFLTRRVNNSGDISWHKGRVLLDVQTKCLGAQFASPMLTHDIIAGKEGGSLF